MCIFVELLVPVPQQDLVAQAEANLRKLTDMFICDSKLFQKHPVLI